MNNRNLCIIRHSSYRTLFIHIHVYGYRGEGTEEVFKSLQDELGQGLIFSHHNLAIVGSYIASVYLVVGMCVCSTVTF